MNLLLATLTACSDGSTRDTDQRIDDGGPAPDGTQAFGESCAGASDCASKLCVDLGVGGFCSRSCEQGCPAGWDCKSLGTGTATVCVPLQENLCVPCTSDAQCGAAGDRCLDFDDGRFCARDCSQSSCPAGYSCNTVERGGETFSQCQPASGSCHCNTDNAGLARGCLLRNANGTCYGTATCEPDTGFVGCTAQTPAVEQCNGVDDDCDGWVDDDDGSVVIPGGARACTFGVGCTGEQRCAPDGGGGWAWTCSYAGQLEESCDGVDNDCDGLVDEAYATEVGGERVYDKDNAHCGGCGNDCSLLLRYAQGTRCASTGAGAHCEPLACLPGSYLSPNGRECLPLVSTTCRACVDDADCGTPGSRCVGIGGGTFCGRDCSATSLFSGLPTACLGVDGTQDCCGAGYVCEAVATSSGPAMQCVPASGTCTCEASSLGVERQCAVDDPSGPGSCRGLERCELDANTYAWSTCEPDPAVRELCNHLDDDCDGLIDEDFIDTAGTGTYDTDEHCGACFNDCVGRWDFEAHHAAGACDTGSAPFTCEMVCATETGWVDANLDPDDGCECHRVSSRDDPDDDFGGFPDANELYVDANCDGIDGVIGRALFVWSGNPNPGPGVGTMQNPFKSVGLALAQFPASGKSYILVASGIYEEQVELSPGVQLHGGYSGDFRSRDIVLLPTVLVAPEPTFAPGYAPGTLHADCSGWTAEPTLVSGFFVYGYDVTTPAAAGEAGHSSYAVYLADCGAGLEVANCSVSGGRGGPGDDGEAGTRGFGAGDSGSATLDGQDGARHATSRFDNAGDCTDLGELVPGGAGGVNALPECRNAGQRGGGTSCPRSYNQPDFYASGLDELHVGFQAGYKECEQTLPDCCPYGTSAANPRDPATWPTCAETPFLCIVPAGETRGACMAKRTCTTTNDCPVGWLCAGGSTQYCELPGSCGVDQDCPSGFECVGAACKPGPYGGNGTGGFDSTMNVLVHGCNQITESGYPAVIEQYTGAPGALGATGHTGLKGAGCTANVGGVIDGAWVGATVSQADGQRGLPGQPGGGGGGGPGIAYHDAGADGGADGDCLRYEIGASGGGGGAGGCGGDGGSAGKAGGASIGLFLAFTSAPLAQQMPIVRDNYVTRGFGGPGGRGGPGAFGGFGGAGGSGTSEDMGWGIPYDSGPGGAGGRGGAGGGGGGGCGGASLGIVLAHVQSAALAQNNAFQLALGATGGRGGAGGASPDAAQAGGAGAAGASLDVAVFCGPSGQCPGGTSCVGTLCQ